jgi:hypothetical protein
VATVMEAATSSKPNVHHCPTSWTARHVRNTFPRIFWINPVTRTTSKRNATVLGKYLTLSGFAVVLDKNVERRILGH